MSNWSGFWGDGASTTGSYELLSGRSPNRYHLARMFKRRGMRMHSEVLFTALADSTPASTASVAHYRVQAARDVTSNVQGGVRTIENINDIQPAFQGDKDNASPNTARAIAAADVTSLNRILEGGKEFNRAPNSSGTTSYPTDGSGNGGGGKLGR